jgi:carbonic anhydrase
MIQVGTILKEEPQNLFDLCDTMEKSESVVLNCSNLSMQLFFTSIIEFTKTRQSPIDINTEEVHKNDESDITFQFKDIEDGIIHLKNESLIVYYSEGLLFFNDNRIISKWKSVQFHFHSPSEHKINGKTYDSEMHMVFKGETYPDELAVLGFLFEASESAESSKFFEELNLDFLNYPKDEGTGISVCFEELFDNLNSQEVFNYLGSLTTPNFDENVLWFLFSHPIIINHLQLKTLSKFWASENFDYCYKGNAREISKKGSRPIRVVKHSRVYK